MIIIILAFATVMSSCGSGAQSTAEEKAINLLKLEEKVINTDDIPDKDFLFKEYFWEEARRSALAGEQTWQGWVHAAYRAKEMGLTVKYDIVNVTSKSVKKENDRESSVEQRAKATEIGVKDMYDVDVTVKISGSDGSSQTRRYRFLVVITADRTYIHDIMGERIG